MELRKIYIATCWVGIASPRFDIRGEMSIFGTYIGEALRLVVL